jgi:rhodanese-related sulfurtransferase
MKKPDGKQAEVIKASAMRGLFVFLHRIRTSYYLYNMKIASLLGLLLLCLSVSFAQLSPDEFNKRLDEDSVQVIDIRTLKEFRLGYIRNAINADWTNRNEFQSKTATLRKDKPLLIYCAAGGRSKAAASWLKERGFDSVFELNGGFNKWKGEDKPVVYSSRERQISVPEYKQLLTEAELCLVFIGAPWSEESKRMKDNLEKLKADPGVEHKVVEIDAAIQIQIMRYLSIQNLPTTILYRNSNEIWRGKGIIPTEDLRAFLREARKF